MGDPIRIWLSGEPRGKGRPRFSRKSGVAYTPAATRSYEGALRLAAQAVMSGRTMLDGPVKVRVIAYMPIPQSWSKRKQADAVAGLLRPTTKPDADNLLKCLDAFDQLVWRDDKQVVCAMVEKFYSETPGFAAEVEAM